MNELGYTHSGDSGQTDFGGHGTIPKTDVRVVAYAECDAANASIAVTLAGGALPPHLVATLVSVQNDLFDLATDLSIPTNSPTPAKARIIPAHTERIERAIEHFEQEAGDLSGMLLPGGTLAGAHLYESRSVVRRAEVAIWRAFEEHPDTVNIECARYMNRVSGLLFVLARGANAEHGDVMWVPESSVSMPAEPVEETGGESH
ncbi:cob(I)yrinic acid a,c-diamide adenosyltransferase [Arthrobacter sp. VKM Ac-2550]|uniref:cob(I)yrinic acid a,c-diamide adenosyltransferase n=1 Tax=Crystallibacter permensis TaxID=1938888 RepID=UPI002225B9B9|nr:cob(I)yrinic acid a,c-diamide adenosyltransferase [Arthrobacter sp. VKM Ac-2550]MCW2134842.1 ATP:cob(I)alamin adenosyltransferase [Arthrobacter sp. VKM Ac-2550]